MYIHQLTFTERKHFERCPGCPICNKPIETFDSFEYTKTPYGKHKLYTFMHTSCVVNYHRTKGGETIEQEETVIS